MRHKLYSLINIGGLSLGFTVCILIFLFVENEFTYDKWLKDSERVFRIETTYNFTDRPNTTIALSPGPIAANIQNHFPDTIEDSTRLDYGSFLVKVGATRFIENTTFVDASFFNLFDLEIVEGSREALFDGFNNIIISETMALKYFGDASPIDTVLDLNNGLRSAKVVAVMKDLPENTHLELNSLMHLNEADYNDQPWVTQWWFSSNVWTYLKLKDAAMATKLEASIPSFLDEKSVPNPNDPDPRKGSEKLSYSLVNLEDIHLYSSAAGQIKTTGDIVIVYSFSGIALLILTIAIINFTNLSTARASLRVREIALRKVVGASRKQIIGQFLGETFLTVLIALLIAFTLVEILLPWFNILIAKILNLNIFNDPILLMGLIAVTLIVGLSAGAHPALHMSAFRPAKVLHSNASAVTGSARLRTILTVIQFTISIGLMIVTLIIYSQLYHAKTFDTGFDKSGKMAIYNMDYSPVVPSANTIRDEILRSPGVIETAFSDRSFPLQGYWDPTARAVINGEERTFKLEQVPVDYDFLEFYNAKLVAGRFFSRDFQGDIPTYKPETDIVLTQAGIVSEKLAKNMGLGSAEEALGQTILIPSGDGTFAETTIVGVTANMQMRSARDIIDPAIFLLRDQNLAILNVNYNEGAARNVGLLAEKVWNSHIPDVPFAHGFIDEAYDALYAEDAERGEIFGYFSLFAIFVSSLGLYGLAAFTAERRTKEIGVRKIMGANVIDIVKLLTIQFSQPVLIANLIAWPVAWYFTRDWLNGFEYRIDLSPIYFVAAGGFALIIACLTVAGHALRTARSNPVVALRHE